MGLVERKWQEEGPGPTMWLVLVGCKKLIVEMEVHLAPITKGPEMAQLRL